MYRMLATWPYLAEMEPKKKKPRSSAASPRPVMELPRARSRSPVDEAPPSAAPPAAADVPESLDDSDPDDMMDLWASRHKMPGGMMEALEKINQMLEAPALVLDDDDDRADASMTERIDALCDETRGATAAALRTLAAGLGKCADARSALLRRGDDGGDDDSPAPLLRSTEQRAKELFAVLDPHGDGACDAAHFENVMESCGLSGAERDAAFAAIAPGDADTVAEATFIAALFRHGALS